MLNTPETRQAALAVRAAEGKALVLADLAKEFSVSIDTIRRDLLVLEAKGAVQRVRGGALPVMRPAAPVLERLATDGQVADRIAVAALPLVEDGMVMILDGGTTIQRFAALLPSLSRALVVTPSPAIALETLGKGIETLLVGGRLSGFGGIAVGQGAVESLGAIAADLCFLGACGLDPEFGLGADNVDEGAVKRAMRRSSNRGVVLTGAAKLGRRARHRVLACQEFDVLVTDGTPDQTEPFHVAGLEVHHAD